MYTVGWTRPHEKHTGNARLLAEGAQPIAGPEQVEAISKALYLHKQKMQRQQAIEATQQRLFGKS